MRTFYILAAASVFLPALIALFKFRQIHKSYHPFIFCLWVGSAAEIISFILVINKRSNHINNNIYVFLEACLLTWFFKEAGLFRKKWLFPALLGLLVSVWIAENFIFSTLTHYSAYFRIIASFLVVFFSIGIINKMLFSNRRHLFGDATFLLCLSFIIYFTYKALIQAFVIYGVSGSNSFLLNIHIIMIYVNLATNLLYALAVLWMLRKPRYLPLSLLPSA